MKSLIVLTAILVSSNAFAWGTQHVRGYTNSYGTYVQPYVRSTPDSNPYNNLGRGYNDVYKPSTRGNGYNSGYGYQQSNE